MVLVQSKYGLGRHQSSISAENLRVYNKIFFCLNVISIAIGTMLLKVSIALNLYRLCKNTWFKWSLRFVIGEPQDGYISSSRNSGADTLLPTAVIIVLYETVGFLFFFLDCKPLAGYWDTTLNAKCASTSTVIAFGLLNTSKLFPPFFNSFTFTAF